MRQKKEELYTNIKLDLSLQCTFPIIIQRQGHRPFSKVVMVALKPG